MEKSQRLLDLYLPPAEGFILESFLATTYQVDFEFCEEELLAAALGVRAAHGASPSAAAAQARPHFEGKDTPKICLEAGLGAPPGASPDESAAAAGRRCRPIMRATCGRTLRRCPP